MSLPLTLSTWSGTLLDSCLIGFAIGLGALYRSWQRRESIPSRANAFLGPFVVVTGLSLFGHLAWMLKREQTISSELFWFLLVAELSIAAAYGVAFDPSVIRRTTRTH
jgi:hypothetical protein